MTPLITAWLLGSVVLEKHFTHDKTLPGNDHYHAMDQKDLKRFVEMADNIYSLLGPTSHKAPIETEEISRLNARRSLVLTRNVDAGHVLDEADVTYKRPGTGISPLHWDDVIGRRVTTVLEEDHLLEWRNLSR